ncbi:hypothetical protein BDZ89DRAFT_1149961, partial [Hymenopellis radicata]
MSFMVTMPQYPTELMLQRDKYNYTSFKVRIESTASGRGVNGYITGTIPRPPIVTPSPGAPPDPATPWYSTAPTREEWDF